jgi:hypothetical protein
MNKFFSDESRIYYFEGRPFLHHDFLKFLFHNDMIVEGIRGGLILGNFHSEGGILTIMATRPNEYEIIVEVEAYEYMMNTFLTSGEMQIVEKINQTHLTKEIKKYSPPNEINIIDARGNKVILMGVAPQFVVNKNATLQNLYFLDELNKNTWTKRVRI